MRPKCTRALTHRRKDREWECRGTFLYDIGLDLLALPYILIVGRLLLQQPTFAVHAHEPGGLVPAVIFCSGFLLLAGAGLERAARRLFHRATHKTRTAPTIKT